MKNNNFKLIFILTLFSFILLPMCFTSEHTFTIGKEHFLLDDKPFQVRCGEIHAARVPRDHWTHRLKMCKAMGLNTVCAYLFWNFHEPMPGQFNFFGRADVAEFCRLAQAEGLWVLLRPGPYACAEWEMGGLPWWLLKHDDIELRSRDPRFIKAARQYMKAVGQQLVPLQVTRGGPILMVQVENEYGFYGDDSKYMEEIRQAILDAGFDVPLFACNPRGRLKNGYLDSVFNVVNFGQDPEGSFAALREILPEGPLMCGEFYPAWFDTWGNPHHTGNMEQYPKDLEYMLKVGASFSVYMAHGGTSFGMWAGADRPFKPDTSSYDYDAPISEAGWVTEKFKRTRDVMSRYLLEGETIPDPPAPNTVISFEKTKCELSANLFENLPKAILEDQPKNYEVYDQAHGCILYRTTIQPGPLTNLMAERVHDFGWVFLDGKKIAVMDRRLQNFRMKIPQRTKPATLDILVYAMGRINFGKEVHDRKGLHGPIRIGTNESSTTLKNWKTYNFPLTADMLADLKFKKAPATGPAFWKTSVHIDQPEDTFLDMRFWGKGIAWVNGRCLGRFWNIGPSQTMYIPGPWLKKSSNEFIIMDLIGPEKPEIAGLKKPILDQLRLKLDFSAKKRPAVKLNLNDNNMVHKGTFSPESIAQTILLNKPVKGRYFCIESLNAHDGKPFAAIAELDLLGPDGQSISHETWTIAYVDSEERNKEDGTAENAIDGQTSNIWQTEWSDKQPGHPHRLIINLGKPQTISAILYTPRLSDQPGKIKDYRVFIGDALILAQED